LQVINRHGKLVQVLNDGVFLDSPWDLAINDNGSQAQVFVSNVLGGTVSRLDLAVGPSNITVLHKTEIAVGYAHQPNAAALVVGPTGLAYDKTTDILYVASTADNTIFAVPKAGKAASFVTKGTPIFAGAQLRGPLALVFAPNGNLLTANGDAVRMSAEVKPRGALSRSLASGSLRPARVRSMVDRAQTVATSPESSLSVQEHAIAAALDFQRVATNGASRGPGPCSAI